MAASGGTFATRLPTTVNTFNAADACDYRDAARSADRSSCGYADGRSTPSPSADETTNNAASRALSFNVKRVTYTKMFTHLVEVSSAAASIRRDALIGIDLPRQS